MSYDVSKLTNLGQMKSALQRIYTEVTGAKSVRTTATISKSNWQVYDEIYKYPNICATSNYHFYDVHLPADTSNTISVMCANADIRAKIENSQINLYCYAGDPTAAAFTNFTLEIIITPTSTNDVGLTYDIGDDFLVYPKMLEDAVATINQTTTGLDNRLTTVENTTIPALQTSVTQQVLSASTITVQPYHWSALSTAVSGYTHKAVINMENITSDHFLMVQFRDEDTASYALAPFATAGSGTVTIYCVGAPSGAIVLPSIIAIRATAVTATPVVPA